MTAAEMRAEGFGTLKDTARNGPLFGGPCSAPHKWDIETEEGILYITCSVCGEAHRLQSKEPERGPPNLTTRGGRSYLRP